MFLTLNIIYMPLTPKFLPPTPDLYISCLLNMSNSRLKPPSLKLHSHPLHPHTCSSCSLPTPPSCYSGQKPGCHPLHLFLSPSTSHLSGDRPALPSESNQSPGSLSWIPITAFSIISPSLSSPPTIFCQHGCQRE